MPRWLRGLLHRRRGDCWSLARWRAAVPAGIWASDYLARAGPARAAATVVDLPRGSGVDGDRRPLADAGAIEHPLGLRRAGARQPARDRSLKAGEYALEPGMSPDGDHGAARERQGASCIRSRCRRA